MILFKSNFWFLFVAFFVTKPIVQDLSNVTVHEGETAKFACFAAGDALPHIQFVQKLNGTDYEVRKLHKFENRTRTRTISTNDKTEFYRHYLWIYNVTLNDTGRYACKAGNSIGVTRKSLYLHVGTG